MNIGIVWGRNGDLGGNPIWSDRSVLSVQLKNKQQLEVEIGYFKETSCGDAI